MSLQDPRPGNSFTDIHLRLMNMRNAVVRKREQRTQPEKGPHKISRQDIILNMATRIAASIHQTLSSKKQQHIAPGKLRAAAIDLLKAGTEPDEVSEKLLEMFG